MTSHLVFHILSSVASTSSFKIVAQHVKLSNPTITRIFDQLSYTPSILPNVLTIDELRGNTNHENYHQASIFISDMWPTYRDLSREFFRSATYVVDKYHSAR